MRTKKLIVAVVGILMLLTTINSCTKEGPIGPAGKDGTNGNANVKDTVYYSVSNDTITTWTHDGGVGDPGFYYLFTCPIITADIAEYGIVQVFVRPSGTQAWSALPFSYPSGSGTYLGYSYGVGAVSIVAQTPPQVYDIKVVAIASS